MAKKPPKPPTKIYTYGLRPPSVGAVEFNRVLRGGHNYYNALLEIERTKQEAEHDFWARLGSYESLLAEYREQRALRPSREDPDRQAVWDRQDELKAQVKAAREGTEAKHLPVEEVFRKQRSKELKKEYKGKELSAESLLDILDSDPRCVSPRRRAQLDFQVGAAARGVGVSAKKLNQELRDAGLGKVTQEIEDRASREINLARAHFGVHYGTYLLIEAQIEQALKTSEGFPVFKRWTGVTGEPDKEGRDYDTRSGEGRVGAPIDTTRGFFVAQIHDGQNAVLQIDPVPESVYVRSSERGTPRGHGESWRMGHRTKMRICVGSGERIKGQRGRNPMWVEFDMVMHRPLPVGGKICAAWVSVFRRGTRTRYELQLQVQAESLRPEHRHGEGITAINFGYRSSGRVAYTIDGRGVSSELLANPDTGRLIDLADKIRGQRQDAANLIRDSLFAWSEELGYPEVFEVGDGIGSTPHWSGVESRAREHPTRSLKARIEGLRSAREKSLSARLQAIFRTWTKLREQTRFDKDDLIYKHLREWVIEDKNQENRESGCRVHARGARNQNARLWAHSLCDSADVILLEDTNYALLKSKAKSVDIMPIEKQTAIARRRDFYAPGELREIVRLTAQNRGVLVVKVSATNLTAMHHACGRIENRDTLSSIVVNCTHCATKFDQDHNFCVGLRERYNAGQNPTPARRTRNRSKSR